MTSDPYVGNHIGGGTDLVVNGSNPTWVTTATNTTVGGGGTAQSAQDIGLDLIIYGGTNATVVSGGTGYGAGGTFTATLVGGTFTTAATFTATYNGSGVVTSLALISVGSYSVLPTGTLSLTGGSGSGLTATVAWWIPGIYKIVGYDSGSGSWILNFAPSSVGATGGKWRIADFRPNNVAGGGAALRAAGIGAVGQVGAIDIGAVQHADPASSGSGVSGARIFTGF